MSEQSISTEFTEDAQGNLNPQTSEDKFFGVQTEITKETECQNRRMKDILEILMSKDKVLQKIGITKRFKSI